MRKLIYVVFVGLLMFLPDVVWAGAYDQLLSIYGGSAPSVPDVPEPTPVDPSDYSNSNYQQPTYNYVDPQEELNREWRREQRQKAREARQQERKKRARQARERQKDREWEEWRKADKERQKQLDIVRKKLPPKWQLKSSSKKSPAAGKVPPLSGLSDMTSVQKQIEALQKQGNLNSQQQAELANLDRRMLDLWKQMVSAEDTPERVRKVLRLPVGLAEAQNVARLDQQKLRDFLQMPDGSPAAEVAKDLVPVRNGVVNFAGDYLQNIIAAAPTEVFEAATDAEMGALMKDGVALAKVTLAFRDTAKGIAALADFVVGRIAVPQAAIAEAGRKIYTNVAFEALNNFMDKASSAVGATHDRSAFWQEIKEESTTGQRAFLEWMGAK
ncbi:MAG: hypothetical protein GQF41_0930 [Candidatus Rifleibacterium amylolyticum]|nr:MAG: hypothetical protein GQF41_0930 [Candidatus Rifleibacterium amylolyticum]